MSHNRLLNAGELNRLLWARRFNGVQWDHDFSRFQISLIGSGARTTAQNFMLLDSFNMPSMMLILNVTAVSGTGGLTLKVYQWDPASDARYLVWVATLAVTATGTYIYQFYPGAIAGSIPNGGMIKEKADLVLMHYFDVGVAVGDASSYTYSLGMHQQAWA